MAATVENGVDAPLPDSDTDYTRINDEEARLNLDFEEDDSPPTPRFMQDQLSYKNFKWVPTSLRRFGKRTCNWAKGPQPPQIHSINPWFQSVQEHPAKLMAKYLPMRRHRVALLLAFYFSWTLSFGIVLSASEYAAEVEGMGRPVNLNCGSTFFYAGNSCGLNGNDCRPFNGATFAFKCPAGCTKYRVLNPRAVGNQEINYQTFVVGGFNESEPEQEGIYRGDSFICPAALHAGVIDDMTGGCGIVSKTGDGRGYASSSRNAVQSVAFDSYFPVSFKFVRGASCDAKDLRWHLFGITLAHTIIFSIFATNTEVYFFTLFTMIFFHVGLASDPPGHANIADLFSNILGKFLPAVFCAFVLYRYHIRRTLYQAPPIERTILWLGALWFGALANYTFDFIPIQRLNAHDLNQQPGAKLALACLVILLVCCVVQQIYYLRIEGRLPQYLALYGTFLGLILTSLTIPHLNLRIHHYILALLLLPGTSMQTRFCFIYSGLLLGLFINGIARWGFDSVLQTESELQGDAKHYSALPKILEPTISLGITGLTAVAHNLSSIAFRWEIPPSPMDGVSVLVNDVERFRGYVDEGFDEGHEFIWTRHADLGLPEYFRFGFMQGTIVWDYTKAAIWRADGSFEFMESGPSKIKRREEVFRVEGLIP